MGLGDRLVQSPAILAQPALGGLLVTDQPSPVDGISIPFLHGTHMALVHGIGIRNAISAIEAVAMGVDVHLAPKSNHHKHICIGIGGRYNAG